MTSPKPSNRSRRLRKKLHLDEFATQGFELDFEFVTEKDADQLDAFIIEFMTDAMEANKLAFMGSACAETLAGVVICEGRYDSVTPEQRQAVGDWLSAHADVKTCESGELTDANELL
ncbi:YggL family protein [Pseudomaricurvus sp.]|uniref:YggL 50S ribosome-binding family protein n=1 Tax=Pseudomaricurvus sp. TaxID=2004510 RepID=UPI003F6C5F1A